MLLDMLSEAETRRGLQKLIDDGQIWEECGGDNRFRLDGNPFTVY